MAGLRAGRCGPDGHARSTSRQVDERFHAVLAFACRRCAHPEDVRIEVVASEAMVVARVTEHQVVAIVTGNHVIPGIAIKLVLPVAAEQGVIAASALDTIVARSTVKRRVVVCAAVESMSPRVTLKPIGPMIA